MADVALLEKRLGEAQAQVAEARRDVKRKRQKVKDEQQKEKKHWAFSSFVVNVLLVLYFLADYRSHVAVAFAHKEAVKRKWGHRADEEIADLIYQLFLNADMHDFAEVTCISDDTPTQVRKASETAVKFKAEYDAAEWAKKNNTKGVAPASATILQRIVESTKASPLSVTLPTEYLFNDSSTGRSYVRRWRKRWGGRYGGIRARNNIEAETSLLKAAALVSRSHLESRFRTRIQPKHKPCTE